MISITKVLRSVKDFLCRRVDGQDGGLSATSIWRAHFRSIFVLSKGLLQIVVNVKLNKYHCFGKCNSSLIPRVPILGFCLLRFEAMMKSCCCHSIFHGVEKRQIRVIVFIGPVDFATWVSSPLGKSDFFFFLT